jgi:hypothetical protein
LKLPIGYHIDYYFNNLFLQENSMNRKITISITVALLMALMIAPLYAQATYDKAVVVQVMRTNGATLGQVKAALNKGDFFAAAEGFWKFAEGMNKIMQYTPPKGSKAEWDKVIGEFVSAALRGAGAAGEKDAAKGLKIVEELQALNKSGHAVFK